MSDIPGCERLPKVGYKRTRSMKDLLTSSASPAQVSAPSSLPFGHYRCGSCSVCPISTVCKQIDFLDLGFSHVLGQFSNCKTKMAIYLLTYHCNLRYVGSTRRQLKVRIQEHVSRIRNNVLEAPLVQHFKTVGHSETDFSCVVLETINPWVDQHKDHYRELLRRESYWIFRLKSLTPNGLNLEIDYSIFLWSV